MKIKNILVSQPRPDTEKSPYFDLAKKCNVEIDFRPFIHVESVDTIEIRKTKFNINDYTAVIMTSRNSIDQFFKTCEKMRIVIPENLKYFCISESTAFYIQKYITYRKRKIFTGKQYFTDLMKFIIEYKNENFLLPCSDILKKEIKALLDKNKIQYKSIVFYKTVCSDLSDLEYVYYDMLVFFSPAGIDSLFKNFPNFVQNEKIIAAYGPTTIRAVKNAGLRIDIRAPTKKNSSMTSVIEKYLKKVNK